MIGAVLSLFWVVLIYGCAALFFFGLFARLAAKTWEKMVVAYFSAKLAYTTRLMEAVQRSEPCQQAGEMPFEGIRQL